VIYKHTKYGYLAVLSSDKGLDCIALWDIVFYALQCILFYPSFIKSRRAFCVCRKCA